MQQRRWFSRPAASDAAAYAADDAADASALDYAGDHTAATCAAVAASAAAATAASSDGASAWRAASVDLARLKQLSNAQPPLTGWDDPRLGPLWPEGAPEWHKQLEREIAEMRAKLDARPDPFAPPIPDETRRKLDDHRKLNELGDQGAFKDCRGQYVFVYNGEFVGHGTELGEARRQAAEKLGVPPSSLVYRYVY